MTELRPSLLLRFASRVPMLGSVRGPDPDPSCRLCCPRLTFTCLRVRKRVLLGELMHLPCEGQRSPRQACLTAAMDKE